MWLYMCGTNHKCKVNLMKEMATINGHPWKDWKKDKKNVYNLNG